MVHACTHNRCSACRSHQGCCYSRVVLHLDVQQNMHTLLNSEPPSLAAVSGRFDAHGGERSAPGMGRPPQTQWTSRSWFGTCVMGHARRKLSTPCLSGRRPCSYGTTAADRSIKINCMDCRWLAYRNHGAPRAACRGLHSCADCKSFMSDTIGGRPEHQGDAVLCHVAISWLACYHEETYEMNSWSGT